MAVADLAAQEYQEVGYLFVVEGWSVGFTNKADLAGTGGDSWIGTTSRTIALGLEVPDTVKLAIGILESGMPIDDGLSLTIVDRDGHLIAFNEDEAGTAVYGRLAPTDVPAPSDLLDGGGLNVPLHGKWINGEAIGAAGERRLYQILPGGSLPGGDHAAIDSVIQDLRASTVQSAARWMEGRLCALYLIRRDPVTGAWASWSSQYTSGFSLLWWGTCRGLSAESHAWKLDCNGPSSWLRRILNANRPADWRRLVTVLELGPNEDKMAAAFRYTTYNAEFQQVCSSSVYEVADTLTVGTPEAMALAVRTRLQTIASSAGPDQTFTAYQNGSVDFDGEKLAIRVDNNNGGTAYGGVLYLRMHKKVWLHMGWDLNVQKRGAAELSTEQEVEADLTGGFKPAWLDQESDPASGYVAALFTTCPVGMYWNDVPDKVDGDGATRIYRRYLEDVGSSGPTVLNEGLEQPLDFGFEGQVPYLEGQLARPPADKTLDAGVCDATCFWAIRGSFRTSIDQEPTTAYALVKVSWPESALTTVEADGDGRCLVWAERYLDQTAFGAPNGEHVGKTWVGLDLDFVPVAFLGYNLDKPDAAHVVLLRLLLSTGTATWTGTEGDPNAAITPGANGHPDALLASGEDIRGTDLEIADLGLGIPQEMIDWGSFVAAAEALPGGKSGALSRTRLAFVGPFDSQEVIEQLLAPRGWCFSLRGARYGLFARGAPLTIDDVEVTITQADIAADPEALPPAESVDFRPLEPIDLIDVRYGGNQLDGNAGEKSLTVKARDPRAGQRRGNAKVEIDGRSLLPDGSWIGDFRLLWGERLARWYAEPHAMVTVPVKGHVARNLWPGTVVRFTSPWLPTREGGYGMVGRLGRVVSVERNLQTLAATVTVLVQAGDPTTLRRFAPLARLLDDVATVEERHNAAARTLYCYKDAWGHDEDAFHDVAAFAEPAWLGIGGDARAYGWSSWDGVTWEKTAEFVVESVDTEDDSITYQAGSMSGAIWERRYTVITLAPYEDQDLASWPRAYFGVVCGSDGKFGAGDVAGFPWVE